MAFESSYFQKRFWATSRDAWALPGLLNSSCICYLHFGLIDHPFCKDDNSTERKFKPNDKRLFIPVGFPYDLYTFWEYDPFLSRTENLPRFQPLSILGTRLIWLSNHSFFICVLKILAFAYFTVIRASFWLVLDTFYQLFILTNVCFYQLSWSGNLAAVNRFENCYQNFIFRRGCCPNYSRFVHRSLNRATLESRIFYCVTVESTTPSPTHKECLWVLNFTSQSSLFTK